MHIFIWIVSGIVAGWLVGLIMKGRGYGLVRDVALGLLGGHFGGWVFQHFGVTAIDAGWFGHVVVAVIGGIVLVAVVRLLRRAL